VPSNLFTSISDASIATNKLIALTSRFADGCSLYSEQMSVNGHSYDRIYAEGIKGIYFLLATDSTGNDELPFG
jgi:hypothetical protein